MSWRQRPARTPLGASPDDAYHGCLDALIVTLRNMRSTVSLIEGSIQESPLRVPRGGCFDVAINAAMSARRSALAAARDFLRHNITLAEERAAICAGLLFDRWIEDTGQRCETIFDCPNPTGKCPCFPELEAPHAHV